MCFTCKRNGELLFCFPFSWRHIFTLLLWIGLLTIEKKNVLFASSRFHKLRNFFYAHMAIHKRPLQLLENSGCYLKIVDMLGDFNVKIFSEELILILITVIWLSSCAIFCNFFFLFIILLMVQTYSNSTVE